MDFRIRLNEGKRGEVIDYLLKGYTLTGVDGFVWSFEREELVRVKVYKNDLFFSCNEIDKVDVWILRHDEYVRMDGDLIIYRGRVDPWPVKVHLMEMAYLNRFARMLEGVETLTYEYACTSKDNILHLRVHANMRTERFDEFIALVREVSDEARTFAIAHSISSKG